MASTVANIYAAMPRATGSLLRAPLGTTGPSSATSDLAPAFLDHGYIGEDGYTLAESRDVDKKKAFGGSTVKILQTDYTLTAQFAFLESTNALVLRAVYGDDNVTVTGNSIAVRHNKRQLPHSSWIIDTLDSDVALRRIWIPDGQISTVDDVQIVHTETIAYTVTVECFEDADGTPLYEWVHKGRPPSQWTVALSATAGTFLLSVDGKPTTALAFDATNAAVRSALAALAGVGTDGVTVTGPAGGPYQITLSSGGTLTGNGTGLTGGTGTKLTVTPA
ncbi:hypothetical protein [Nocardia iowensis]|uniref:Major tail protein n=1 Tax=Nocardia iowensis TaxID=204891 RepID=A0ABX8RQK9_NOCIO|nr:hypothetical protein [Nocardia iowensis]QXN91904.1 hypothetical protein KV110_01545 [Nocardia iowensis]